MISISKLSKKWNVPFITIKRGVVRLGEIGIIEETTNRKRNKLFIAPKLMKLVTSTDKKRN